MGKESWFRYYPASEDVMTFVGRHYTVCDVLRSIYRETDSPSIKMKCRIATTMAKSLTSRLSTHEGPSWGEEQYPITLSLTEKEKVAPPEHPERKTVRRKTGKISDGGTLR